MFWSFLKNNCLKEGAVRRKLFSKHSYDHACHTGFAVFFSLSRFVLSDHMLWAKRWHVLTNDTLTTCLGKRWKRLGKHIIHRFTLNKITHVINEIFVAREDKALASSNHLARGMYSSLWGNCVNKSANFLFVMKTSRKRCWFNSVTAKQWNNEKKLSALKDGNSLLFSHLLSAVAPVIA